MRIQALIVAGLTGLVVSPALAQPLFANPLDTPEGYREGRGATPDAKHRIRYEVTETQGSGASEVYEVTIDVASNWSLYRKGEIAVLNDFGLNRIFTLEGDTFSTVNGMSNLVFRVMERQNRTYLKDVLAAATAGEPMITDCQSDSELGLSLPMQKSDSILRFGDRQGFTALICDGADVGGFTAGSASAPPALWPSLFHIAPMHPALLKRMRETGAVPATFETERTAGDTTIKRSFRLVDVESVSASYPLTDDLRNTTAETFDNLIGPDGGTVCDGRRRGRGARRRADPGKLGQVFERACGDRPRRGGHDDDAKLQHVSRDQLRTTAAPDLHDRQTGRRCARDGACPDGVD